MAELLGAIDTDYQSPKITDDLIQIGAAKTQTEILNLQSQMVARQQDTAIRARQSETQAANTASLIQSRADQSNLANRQAQLASYRARVEADKTYNLIDMNLRQAEREDLKMPYVLEGLEAENWINQTIAEGNELTNEFNNATIGDRIESAALDAQTKLASLNGKRAENQRLKAQNDRESADQVVWTEVMDKLDRGVDIDTLNPRFKSKSFKTQYADLKQSEQKEREYRASVVAAEEDAKIRVLKLNALKETQREAYSKESDPAVKAQLMQDSLESNAAIKRLRDISGSGSEEADRILQNRDPLTGGEIVEAQKLVDQYGNLTDNGKTALNAAVSRSEAKRAATTPALEAIRLRHQLAQPTEAQVQLAQQRRRDDLVQSFVKSIPDDAGDPLPPDADPNDTVTPYTPQRKLEIATEMADALMLDSATPTQGRPGTGRDAPTFTSALEKLRASDPAAGLAVDKLAVEAAAINKIILDWGRDNNMAAFDNPEGTPGAPSMDGWWTGDIDREEVIRDADGKLISGMEQSTFWGSTWDSSKAAIVGLRNEILDKMGPKGEAEMFDITKPHPWALRQWGAIPPAITLMRAGEEMLHVKPGDAAWAYNKDEPDPHNRWTRIMLIDKFGKRISLYNLRYQHTGKLISGIDFSDFRGDSGRASDFGRPTPNNSTPAAW